MFSAINAEKFLNYWSPTSLKELIAWERKKMQLPSDFRSVHESAVMYKMLTTAGTTRFYNKGSIFENIAEVILRTRCTNTQAIHIIKSNLDLIPALRTREAVHLMLHMLIDPNAFEDAASGIGRYYGKLVSLENQAKLPEYREDEFRKYFNAQTPLPRVRVYDLLPEQKEAMSLYCTVFSKPEDIIGLFDDLLGMFHAKVRANSTSPHALAAFIHNGIIAIHPFTDGNGRIARFMMNRVFDFYGLKQLDPKAQGPAAELRYDQAVASEDDNVLVQWMAAEHLACEPRPSSAPLRHPVRPQHPLLQNHPICQDTENLAKKILAFSIWKQALKPEPSCSATPLGERPQQKAC